MKGGWGTHSCHVFPSLGLWNFMLEAVLDFASLQMKTLRDVIRKLPGSYRPGTRARAAFPQPPPPG